MTKNCFASEVFWSSQVVYIDTATLMNVGTMRKFINKYGDEIRRSGRKIRVPLSVQHELSRHLCGNDYQKSAAAMDAKILLGNNSCLFELQGVNRLDKEEINKAFADPELLATLIMNKPKESQTLITNDRKLGENAYDINSWQSCSGYAITVCYIDWNGVLCKNDRCSELSLTHEQHVSSEAVMLEEVDSNTEAEPKEVVVDEIKVESTTESVSQVKKSNVKTVAFSALGFITGVLTYRYGKGAVCSTKRFTERAFRLASQIHVALM